MLQVILSYATCVNPNACSAPARNNTRNCTSYTGPTCYDDSGYSYYSCTGCSSGYSLEYTSVCGHSLGYCSRDSSPDPDPDPDPGVCERPSSCESYSTSYGSYSYNSIASWNQSTCTCSWSYSYTCNSGYYGSGRSCTKCPASHPSGGGDGTTISNCYKSCSRACTKPACPAGANCSYGNEYTYGTEYYGGSCNAAASTCSLTVTSCNSGYYKDGNSCVLCPESYPNSASGATSQSGCYATCGEQSITGGNRVPVSSTVNYPNSCEYTTVCNDGYNQSSDGVCSQLCGLGFTTLRTGSGLVIPLYSEKLSSPAIHIGYNGGMCYGILESGSGDGINLEYNGQTYHTGK